MMLLPLFFVLLFACADEPIVDNSQEENTETQNDPLNCDATKRPIVMVHGALASGDTYELQFQRFESNGYCPEHLFVLDWNTLNFGGDATGELDALIDQVIAQTGFDKVDLAGHSAGSSTSYSYLSDPARAAKVAHYIHLAGNPQAGPAGPDGEVPTMNVWSEDDLIVTGGEIPGAENVFQTGKDHYEVATSKATFLEMYEFFNDEAPEWEDIIGEATVNISGRVVTFGENTPMAAATVNIYQVDSLTGNRINATPDFTLTSDDNGRYGPVNLPSCVTYEFEVNTGQAGDRTVHYYREGFLRSDQLVYLRTIPTSGIGGILLGGLPQDDDQTVLAFYSGSRAVINGRDELTVAGSELATPEFTAPINSTIAMFYYDGNNNQTTDLTGIGGSWALVPTFLAAVDMYHPTEPAGSIELELNGKKLVVPNLKSGTDGVIVAVFN